MINITIERRHAFLIAAFVVMAALVIPAGVWASDRFSDVPDSNPFHDDIDFIADRGITLGCGGGNYCPDDFVTREQMAAFMKRSTGTATSSISQKSGNVATGGSHGSCKTDPYTPFYEEQVILQGSLTAPADNDATADFIGGVLEYRTDGGGWIALGTKWMWDGNSADATEFEDMSVAMPGALALTPGVAYEFAFWVSNSGANGDCVLLAQHMNRMPGQGVGQSGNLSVSGIDNDRAG